ncbi:MAG: hypothetical protein KBD31_01160 [Proteobacteria bacterium]|nr:hypothetical protein [Pseudomonadota bacterium]
MTDILDLPPAATDYKKAYDDFLNCLEDEERYISEMDLNNLQFFEHKKNTSFKQYTSALKELLERLHTLKDNSSLKAFLKESQAIIQQKMASNMRLLKIEASLLNGLFLDLSKQFKRPIVTYGSLKKSYKTSHFATLPTKEL